MSSSIWSGEIAIKDQQLEQEDITQCRKKKKSMGENLGARDLEVRGEWLFELASSRPSGLHDHRLQR